MRKKSPSASEEGASRDLAIITLLSDFGNMDPYVGSMKGVILSITRNARIVDLTHNVTKFNVLEGAFILAAVIPYFPSNTIHVAVVDPGVGGKRKALLVKTKRSYLIGPDNGILMLAANQDGIDKVIEIRNPRYMLPEVSPTFHGRDVFCPIAAYLASGTPVDNFGPETNDYLRPEFSKPSITDDWLSGEIIHVDDFGNIVTNITSRELMKFGVTIGSTIGVAVGPVSRDIKFRRTYGDVDAGDHLALIGSTGFFEISVNRGNAASFYGAREGTRLRISRC